MNFVLKLSSLCRMAPEVIACDENPEATYDNRSDLWSLGKLYDSTFDLIFIAYYRVYTIELG